MALFTPRIDICCTVVHTSGQYRVIIPITMPNDRASALIQVVITEALVRLAFVVLIGYNIATPAAVHSNVYMG